ncbi:lytic transglycosylase domain-containing protein [Desulfovibrio sp. OttesenSCG-928-M14]|nr:lytic transglycosylase domain-containing protein [Desulfovibrio sp. OttesenSCG-928-M14]
MKTIIVAALFLPAFLALHAFTSEAATQARRPEGSGVPPELVRAVSRQESGLNPLAVNVAGVAHYPATVEEAEAIITAAQKAGKSYDVGLMQINSWWIAKFSIPVRDLLDPDINTRWGTWILAQEIARHGLNWFAVGKYHSPDVERGRRYTWHVYRHYASGNARNVTPSSRQEQSSASKSETQPVDKNLCNTGGLQRNTGVSRQGRFVPFNLHEKGQSRSAGKKP